MSSPTRIELCLKLPLSNTPPTKPLTTSYSRLVASPRQKSSLSYPTIITHSTKSQYSNSHEEQQNTPILYVVNTPVISRRSTSARPSISSLNSLPLHQQPLLAHSHYGHFLAYLRRQSLARLRRKQQENTDNIDTKVTLNSSKKLSQSFHSISNISLGTLPSETIKMPPISLTSKQNARPLSPYRPLQRSSSLIPTNYRLNLNQSSSTKKTSDDQLSVLPSKSVLITRTNSIVDEKSPYELHLNGDMLSYCYISDSGVTYQGELLSTSV